ncbi:MAG: hypothetical protein ACE5R4_11095 [Armatimonadota bacterium]
MAILIMLLILLIGAAFVAVVIVNQTGTIMHEDMISAREGGEWGIRLAHDMMLHSPEGGDWRPPAPPVWMEDGVKMPTAAQFDLYYDEFEQKRGWFTRIVAGALVELGYTKYPNPLDPAPGSKSFRPGVYPEGSSVLLRVTYDPTRPWPEGKYIWIESIGHIKGARETHHKMLALKPYGITDFGRFITDRSRRGVPAKLGFEPNFDLNVDSLIETIGTNYSGGIRCNTDLVLVGDSVGGSGTNTVLLAAGETMQVAGEISFETPAGIVPNTNIVTPTASGLLLPSTDPLFDTYGGQVLDRRGGADPAGFVRQAKSLAAPDLEREAETSEHRYLALTRDSGTVITAATDAKFPTPVELSTGLLGYGLGIYVDNASDVQYQHDLDLLERDWLQELDQTIAASVESSWNSLGTTYTPPGVEVTLYYDELSAAGGDLANISGDPLAVLADTTGALRYWPGHVPGEPGIRLVREDARTFRGAQISTWVQPNGLDSQLHEIYLDYPANGVIACEGNVRIKGVLPSYGANPANVRDYNLTVYSGATIYIEGDIECADTLVRRQTGAAHPDDATLPNYMPALGETKIALLARDSVCLNPTQFVPQRATGTTAALEDDPLNPNRGMHWELNGPGDAVFSEFMIPRVEPGATLNLVAKQSGEDPGPCVVSLLVNGVPYVFGGGATGAITVDPSEFAFVPPGYLPLGTNVSYALSPQYEWLVNGASGLPWDLSLLLTPAPALQTITFVQNTPQVTEYWLRKFKLEQMVGGAVTGALDAQVCALIYAERGSWFVIPGQFFEARAGRQDLNGDGAIALDEDGDGINDAERFKRYNYSIRVIGAINEDHPAPVDAVREWQDKWSYPDPASATGWSQIQCLYDPTLIQERVDNLAMLPALPVSEDLIFVGTE